MSNTKALTAVQRPEHRVLPLPPTIRGGAQRNLQATARHLGAAVRAV
ncbi:hypothetical protein AAFN86_25880 [Roseomonas sp. CAU 1739]